MGLDRFPSDRQSQSRPLGCVVLGVGRPDELLHDVIDEILGDPDPVVLDLDPRRCILHGEPHGYLSVLVGVLDGVLDQIFEGVDQIGRDAPLENRYAPEVRDDPDSPVLCQGRQGVEKIGQ